jgi:hypothetical protein
MRVRMMDQAKKMTVKKDVVVMKEGKGTCRMILAKERKEMHVRNLVKQEA